MEATDERPMNAPEQDPTDAGDAPGPGTVDAGDRQVVDAAAVIEALARRDRQGDAPPPVDLETIHERARLAAKAASDVKGEDVKILDMHELVTYIDFLVLSTGRNVRLTKRIAEEVAFKLKQAYGILPAGREGLGGGEWILLDYLDFMVHVFTPEAREFYRLDVLWKRAPVETIE